MEWISNLVSHGYSLYPFDKVTGAINSLTLPTEHQYQYVDALFNSLRYYAQVTISDTGSISGNYFGISGTFYYGKVTWTDSSLGDLTDKIAVSPDLNTISTQSVFRIVFITTSSISGQHPKDTSESTNNFITEYTYNNGVHSMTFYCYNYQWYQMDYQGTRGRIQLRYLDGTTTFKGLSAFDLVNVTSYHALEKATSTVRYDMYNAWCINYGGSIDLFACYSSSILIPRFNAYFTTSGSSATADANISHGIYYLYDQNGQLIVYDSSKTYILESIKRYNGEVLQGGGYYLVNSNGYLAFEQSNYGYIFPYVIQYLAL